MMKKVLQLFFCSKKIKIITMGLNKIATEQYFK